MYDPAVPGEIWLTNKAQICKSFDIEVKEILFIKLQVLKLEIIYKLLFNLIILHIFASEDFRISSIFIYIFPTSKLVGLEHTHNKLIEKNSRVNSASEKIL